MNLATAVYKQYLESRGIKRRVWRIVREVLVRLFSDPTCALSVHGKLLKLPLSHALPYNLERFPFYDRLPRRLSEFLHKKQGYLCCIDVGANVGDTIAAFYMNDRDAFLAIEPNTTFNKLLSDNWGGHENVTVVSDICSSSNGEDVFAIQENKGTASILQAANGARMSKRTLDEIVSSNPFAANANALKIDTDGHDFEVIAGSEGLLSRNLPAVLFECDAFQNVSYVEDCLKTLDFLKQRGFHYFLLYNNTGNLMGRHSLSDLAPLRNLLFFQLTSSFEYFDILVMKDEDIHQFYRAEIDYFVDKMPDKLLQHTAIIAAALPTRD